MNAATIRDAAYRLSGNDDPFLRQVGVWLTGVSFGLDTHRLSGGSSEACHAHQIAAAYMGVAP